jgi:hypothetical protein
MNLFVDDLSSVPVDDWKFYVSDSRRWRVGCDVNSELEELRKALRRERQARRQAERMLRRLRGFVEILRY